MAKKTRAGDLYYLCAFEKKGSQPDGYGGMENAWSEQFRCRAAFVHLRGGEGVQAARLEGKHPQVITVRASAAAKLVTSDWRVKNVRTGDIFAIRDIEPVTDRAFIGFLCERGVAP